MKRVSERGKGVNERVREGVRESERGRESEGKSDEAEVTWSVIERPIQFFFQNG